jgi:excisionase family DNA binding protein
MNGRDLILYILENNLENEPVFQNGKLLGFMSINEYAVKTNVGAATVCAWVAEKRIPSIRIGDTLFIPANCKLNVGE